MFRTCDSCKPGLHQVFRMFLLSCLLLPCLVLAGLAQTPPPPTYTIIDLGTLGNYASGGSSINASGQITGSLTVGPYGPLHTFIYTPGTNPPMVDLGGSFFGSTSQSQSSYGSGINASGQIVGTSDTGSNLTNPFLYSAGTITNLGTLNNYAGFAYGNAINDSGLVTGESQIAYTQYHAFVCSPCSPGNLQLNDIDANPADLWSEGYGINASGQVTGLFSPSGTLPTYAFLYTPGTSGWVNLGVPLPNSYWSQGFGINDAGQVTGGIGFNDGSEHAFLYSGGDMTDLDPGGSVCGNSQGASINNLGQIVGSCHSNAGSFLYTPGANPAFVDLATLLPPGLGWQYVVLGSINDSGQMTGTGNLNGVGHAVLIVPGTWTMQTGGTMQPGSTSNLSQQFVFNNTTGQHVEFDFDYTKAYNTNNDLTVLNNTIPSVTNQGITQATYQGMVYATSLATTACYIAPGEGTDTSGNPLCAQLTLTCTNANSSTPAGDNCPQSKERNLYIAQPLSTPAAAISIPPNTAPILAMGSDTWSPGNCTLTGPEAGNLCPQSTLTHVELQSADITPKPGGTTKTTNSAFIVGCCEPEWNTAPQIPAWSNSTTVPVSFTSSPPVAPVPNPNNWVPAPNLSITWGWESLGQTPDTTFPVLGDQMVTNATPCPSNWPPVGTILPNATASGDVTVPGEGAFEVHFFSTACDNQEELVFPSSVGSGTPLNINLAKFKTAPFNVDLTKPVVSSITLNPPPSGGYYAQNSSVTASFTCTDPVSNGVASGVATCGPGSTNYAGQNPVVVSAAPVPTGTLGAQTFTAIATDVAGNSSAPSLVNYTVVGPANVDVGMAGNLLVKSGQNITYLVGIANLGPNTADLVNLVGSIPAGTTFVSSGYTLESCTVTNHKPTCALSPPTNYCGSVAGSCSIGTLPVWTGKNLIGALVQVTVKVTALPGATIKNTVSVGAANTNLAPNTTASWLTKVVK